MRTHRHRTLLTLLAFVPSLGAWRTLGEPLHLAPQSRLWIDGRSNVRKFSCKAPEFTVDVDATHGAIASVLAGKKAVQTVTVRVPAAKMECGNGTMNEHMLKALKVNDAPTIEFTLASYDVAKNGAGVDGTLTGTLSLGGTQRSVSITARGLDAGDGKLHVTGAVELDMREYGLKPPTLMLGTMKVAPAVTVNFDLVLQSGAVVALERGA